LDNPDRSPINERINPTSPHFSTLLDVTRRYDYGPNPWGISHLCFGNSNCNGGVTLAFKIPVAETTMVFNRSARVPWMDGSDYFGAFILTIPKDPTYGSYIVPCVFIDGRLRSFLDQWCQSFWGFSHWELSFFFLQNP
jgi:hypothetical protein